jgi:hypothetical protein
MPKRKLPPPGLRARRPKLRWDAPGWICAIPSCGPNRDLVRVGHSAKPHDLALNLRLMDWPIPATHPDNGMLFAIQVDNRADAMRRILSALMDHREGRSGLFRCGLETVMAIITQTLGSGPMIAVSYNGTIVAQPTIDTPSCDRPCYGQ